jgi:hypothetical protein
MKKFLNRHGWALYFGLFGMFVIISLRDEHITVLQLWLIGLVSCSLPLYGMWMDNMRK